MGWDEESAQKADQRTLSQISQGGRTCFFPRSENLTHFFENEIYHFTDRDGCVDSEVIRQYFGTSWFRPTLQEYGFHLE